MYLLHLVFVQVLNLHFLAQAGQPSGYIGCFKDSRAKRVLPEHLYTSRSKNNGKECKGKCSSAGYRFAGTQFRSECWCGNQDPGERLPSDNYCNFPCRSNKGEFCGGLLHLSIYDTWETTTVLSSVHTENTNKVVPTRTSPYSNSSDSIITTDDTENVLLLVYIGVPVVTIACVFVIVGLIWRQKNNTRTTKSFQRETESVPNTYANSSIMDQDIDLLRNTTSIQYAFENMAAYTEIEIDANTREHKGHIVNETTDTNYNILNDLSNKTQAPENTYDHTQAHGTYLEDNAYSKIPESRINTQLTAMPGTYSHINGIQPSKDADATYHKLNGEISQMANIDEKTYSKAVKYHACTDNGVTLDASLYAKADGDMLPSVKSNREMRDKIDKLDDVKEDDYDIIEE